MAAMTMRRNIITTAEGVPSTFSSWDSCMSKAYCKWPVICGIIVGSLIALSIIWCLARCLCCGMSCCCSCLRCLDCFTPGRHGRDRNSRYRDDYRPMPNQGFQTMPSPMVYQSSAPQFATFDAPTKKVNEDSLPAMPSWDDAQERRVEDTNHEEPAQGHGDDVEMGRVNSHNQNQQQRLGRGGYSQLSHGPASPVGSPPYGRPDEYFGGVAAVAGGVASHPYNSDLGTQQLGPTRQQSYPSDFQPAPSPAPTYATHDPQQNTLLAAGDRFVPGAASPSPDQYNRRPFNSNQSPPPSNFSRPQRQNSDNFSRPYAPTISTQYEPSNYPPSYRSPPPRRESQSGFGYPRASQDGGYENVNLNSPMAEQRPPSLLQVGRKPVMGSYREV